MMNRWASAAVLVIFGLTATACKSESTAGATASASAAAQAAKSAAPAASAPSRDKGGPSGTGVKACDDYVATFQKCMKDQPGADEMLDATRGAWKEQKDEATLEKQCKTALDALKMQPQCK